jgi:hypothetical protein
MAPGRAFASRRLDRVALRSICEPSFGPRCCSICEPSFGPRCCAVRRSGRALCMGCTFHHSEEALAPLASFHGGPECRSLAIKGWLMAEFWLASRAGAASPWLRTQSVARRMTLQSRALVAGESSRHMGNVRQLPVLPIDDAQRILNSQLEHRVASAGEEGPWCHVGCSRRETVTREGTK